MTPLSIEEEAGNILCDAAVKSLQSEVLIRSNLEERNVSTECRVTHSGPYVTTRSSVSIIVCWNIKN